MRCLSSRWRVGASRPSIAWALHLFREVRIIGRIAQTRRIMVVFAHQDDLQRTVIRDIGDKRLSLQGGHLAMFASGRFGEAYEHQSRTGSAKTRSAEEAIVVVHGALRNAGDYFHAIEAAAGSAGREPLIIAPQFLTTDDIREHGFQGGALRWGTEEWKSGLGETSSFTVMDELLERLLRTPGLRRVTLVGNSAGGQFVNRYAAVGRIPGRGDVRFRFVVANPSTYLYFDRQRPHKGRFMVNPDPAVDRWRYGFTDAPGYVTGTADDYFGDYIERDVVYLVGVQDADPGAVLLEVHPAAEAQGPTRLERAVNYHAYLEHKAGRPVHELVIVPGVGHDATELFSSPRGRACLFPV
jgi:hypothetical protein